MDLFEFEGKALLAQYGIPVPHSQLVTHEHVPAPLAYPFVLKAQVLTGGRGKAGGVKVCHNDDEYKRYASNILHMEIKGHKVHGLLAEEMAHIQKELYLSITLQGVSKPTLIFSNTGGMDIETVAATTPDKICKIEIDPFTGLKAYQLNYLAKQAPGIDKKELIGFVCKVEKAFFNAGAKLVEINPLGVVDGKLMALDSKFVIDDNARSMQETMTKLEEGRKQLFSYQPPEKEQTTITYVPLEGNIALISDGAGTGMLTLDLVHDHGGKLASFCELGGMTSEEVMYRALEVSLSGRPHIQGVIIVLIGGFNRMDNMARGILRYVTEHKVNIPIFTRMCGTMEEEGLRIMQEAGLPTYYDLTETVELVCAVGKEA